MGFCTVDFDVDVERVVVVAGVVGSLEEVMIDYLTSRALEMYISTVLVWVCCTCTIARPCQGLV